MNWDRVEGNWKQLSNWKQLTGKMKERDQLEGKLQERYGLEVWQCCSLRRNQQPALSIFSSSDRISTRCIPVPI